MTKISDGDDVWRCAALNRFDGTELPKHYLSETYKNRKTTDATECLQSKRIDLEIATRIVALMGT